ncbi:hypothetical protein ACFLZ2_00920 [Candidatus Margulisiibacteriota bacterium]
MTGGAGIGKVPGRHIGHKKMARQIKTGQITQGGPFTTNGMSDVRSFLKAHSDFTVFMSQRKLEGLCTKVVDIEGQKSSLISLYLDAVAGYDWDNQQNPIYIAMHRHKLHFGFMHVVISAKRGPERVTFLAEDRLINQLKPGQDIRVMKDGIMKNASFVEIEKTGHDWWIVHRETVQMGQSRISIEVQRQQEELDRRAARREEEEEIFQISIKKTEG